MPQTICHNCNGVMLQLFSKPVYFITMALSYYGFKVTLKAVLLSIIIILHNLFNPYTVVVS